jgi:thiosulfate/3-mercaptopyruvate sulfurtransferase
VICPGGAGGAKRTIDYLESENIDGDRLFILENGQGKWPYEELLDDGEVSLISFEDESYFVNSQWLKNNIEREDVLVLDARGEEPYKEGHIPGAVEITWQGFSNMNGALGTDDWGTVLEEKDLAKKLAEYGVSSGKEIVVYANTTKGWGEDGRIVWMLRRAGLKNSKILDGGYGVWKSNGYEVSKELVTPVPSTVEMLELSETSNIGTADLKSKLGEVVIIDTRELDEYEGAAKFGEARGGHLPGSVKITFNEFLTEEGTLKTPVEIKAILDENGINKDDEIVTYCTAGIRSAHMQIVLDAMGYNNSKNYDSSFYAWAGAPELELVK